MVFYLKLFLYWSITGLQCCIGFWCISHMYPGMPCPLSLPSSHHSTHLGGPEHQAEFPVLYISVPLAVCFTHGGIYMSALLSHFMPLLSPLCPQVHSLCLCFCGGSANRIISIIFLDSIYIYINIQ